MSYAAMEITFRFDPHHKMSMSCELSMGFFTISKITFFIFVLFFESFDTVPWNRHNNTQSRLRERERKMKDLLHISMGQHNARLALEKVLNQKPTPSTHFILCHDVNGLNYRPNNWNWIIVVDLDDGINQILVQINSEHWSESHDNLLLVCLICHNQCN